MSSEMRFAWICRNIHFDEIHRIELTDEMLLSGDRPSWITTTNCEVIAKLRSAGLSDNKRTPEFPYGQEIYEGDIVRSKHGVGVVTFNLGSFIVDWNKEMLNKVMYFWNEDGFEGRVIGNIYQNPELLKQVA